MKIPLELWRSGLHAALLAAACCTPAALAQSFTIVGACVFDGERLLPPGTEVRVEHGLILAVGPRVGVARGATVIDARGQTLLPGAAAADGRLAARTAQQLAAAGAAPAQALRAIAGTNTAAPAQDPAGIVTGARADFFLLQGDAAADLRTLSGIVAVWRHGLLIRDTQGVAPAL